MPNDKDLKDDQEFLKIKKIAEEALLEHRFEKRYVPIDIRECLEWITKQK